MRFMGATALVLRLLHNRLAHVGPSCKGRGRGAKKAC